MFFPIAPYYGRPVNSKREGVNIVNEEKIIRAIREGSESAMGQVIDRYSRLMWSIVSGVLREAASEQDMEECVADVFIYLWEHPEKYDPRRGKLKVWLSIVARSRAIDRYRELSRRSDVPLEDTLAAQRPEAEDQALANEERQALSCALQALREPEREIVIRRYYQGQKPREIAAALNVPVKQVENRLYRAKRMLRDQISD